MSTVVYCESWSIKPIKTIFAVGALVLVAGCSTASDRFGPFDTASQSADPGNSLVTGSANQTSGDATQYSRDVAATPLDSPSSGSVTPSYQQAVYTPQNGEVTVRPGDTLYSISRAHNVSVGDMIAVNHLQAPYSIQSGQRLKIPGTATAQAASYTESGSSNVRTASLPTTHTVRAGETLYSISRSYGHRAQTVAAYNRLSDVSVVRIGQQLNIPAANWTPSSAQTAALQPTQATPARTQAATAEPAPERQAATVSQQQTESATNASERGDQAAADQAIPARTSSRFRWPVRGRVISEFGTKPDGTRNDGINLAVPEGASVKAAENGVVAYAGNELQGYGNLILIRHADNWVTAYAHASEILVRRGDVVSRGQIIAKSGQTGNVTAPQLHFEIRQGAQAVDPIQHLAPNSVAGD